MSVWSLRHLSDLATDGVDRIFLSPVDLGDSGWWMEEVLCSSVQLAACTSTIHFARGALATIDTCAAHECESSTCLV